MLAWGFFWWCYYNEIPEAGLLACLIWQRRDVYLACGSGGGEGSKGVAPARAHFWRKPDCGSYHNRQCVLGWETTLLHRKPESWKAQACFFIMLLRVNSGPLGTTLIPFEDSICNDTDASYECPPFKGPTTTSHGHPGDQAFNTETLGGQSKPKPEQATWCKSMLKSHHRWFPFLAQDLGEESAHISYRGSEFNCFRLCKPV